MKIILLSLAGTCAFLSLVFTLPATDLGDPAPALQIAEWVKGKPVDLAAGKGKRVYVVEFWATWCPPCRASIPHLTDLQKKFKDKDVTVVGITDEKSPVVKKFLTAMGDKMDYTVALDSENKTAEGYMGAFGINGIPHAFVVDREGRLVWHGHPMSGLDKVVEQVAAGKFDITISKKKAKAEKMIEEFFELAASGEDAAKLDKLGKELEALEKEVGGIMDGQKFDAADMRKRAKFQRLVMEYQAALTQDDTNKLAELEKKMETGAPAEFKLAEFKSGAQLQKLFGTYYEAVTAKPDKQIAADSVRKIEALDTKNAQMLNALAWAILTDEKIKERDVPFATKLAKAAYDACEGKEASIVDTYARALFDSGKVDEAVRYQKKALALCKDDETRAELEKNLQTYQAKAQSK